MCPHLTSCMYTCDPNNLTSFIVPASLRSPAPVTPQNRDAVTPQNRDASALNFHACIVTQSRLQLRTNACIVTQSRPGHAPQKFIYACIVTQSRPGHAPQKFIYACIVTQSRPGHAPNCACIDRDAVTPRSRPKLCMHRDAVTPQIANRDAVLSCDQVIICIVTKSYEALL